MGTDVLTLHLGVVDVPYANDPKGKSTGDVAEILEEKYHVMRVFFEYNKEFVAKELEEGLCDAFESVLMGGPIQGDAFGAGCSEIQQRGRDDLSQRMFDARGIPGVPTNAALRGVSHRFKHPYKKRPERPSFIDTGLYKKSFRAWVD